MSVRPSSDWDAYAPQKGPSRLHAVLSAGEAQRKAATVPPMRRQSSFEHENAPPPSLRPQVSYNRPIPDAREDERTWGEWAYEKYDTGKEKVKGAGRYAQDKYNDAASVFAARKVRHDIEALEDEMRQIELDSPEYEQKAAELMALRDRLTILKYGIAARVGLTSIDDEEIAE